MTPKEKANEFCTKYEFIYIENCTSKNEVKQYGLITVDEIIKVNPTIPLTIWQEVKSEIEKL